MQATIAEWTGYVHAFFQTPLGYAILAYLAFALATFMFKPRSPNEYAALATRSPVALFSRIAAFWQLIGGLGLDPRKVAVALVKVLSGRTEPPSAKGGGDQLIDIIVERANTKNGSGLLRATKTVGVAAACLITLLVSLTVIPATTSLETPVAPVLTAQGCTPGQRAIAKDALSIVQTACIIANQAKLDADVAKVCGVAEPFLGPMKDILGSARESAGAARRQTIEELAGSSKCGDAGLK